jgi:hypothetical protein
LEWARKKEKLNIKGKLSVLRGEYLNNFSILNGFQMQTEKLLLCWTYAYFYNHHSNPPFQPSTKLHHHFLVTSLCICRRDCCHLSPTSFITFSI